MLWAVRFSNSGQLLKLRSLAQGLAMCSQWRWQARQRLWVVVHMARGKGGE